MSRRRRKRDGKEVEEEEEEEQEEEERRPVEVALTAKVARRPVDRNAARGSVESHRNGKTKDRGSSHTGSTHRCGSL